MTQLIDEVVMSEPSLRDWRTLYAAAMLEGDNTQVRLRIDKAETAIHARLYNLEENISALEEAELCSALRNLQRLKPQTLALA